MRTTPTDDGLSQRLPGGGPASRWSPRRLAPSAWWWTGTTLALALAVALVLVGMVEGVLDVGVGAVVLLAGMILTALVFSWTWGTVAERVRHRVGDDVRVYADGTPVVVRRDPEPAGDDRAVAAVERDGRPIGVLRERQGRRGPVRRTVEVDGREYRVERETATEPGTGRRHRTFTVHGPDRGMAAVATRYRQGALTDWRIDVADRVLWLRAVAGRRPHRRTLLDDLGRAWRSRPRRGGRELAVDVPAEMATADVAVLVGLLVLIEADRSGRPTGGDGTGVVDDTWTRDSNDSGAGDSGGDFFGGDSPGSWGD